MTPEEQIEELKRLRQEINLMKIDASARDLAFSLLCRANPDLRSRFVDLINEHARPELQQANAGEYLDGALLKAVERQFFIVEASASDLDEAHRSIVGAGANPGS